MPHLRSLSSRRASKRALKKKEREELEFQQSSDEYVNNKLKDNWHRTQVNYLQQLVKFEYDKKLEDLRDEWQAVYKRIPQARRREEWAWKNKPENLIAKRYASLITTALISEKQLDTYQQVWFHLYDAKQRVQHFRVRSFESKAEYDKIFEESKKLIPHSISAIDDANKQGSALFKSNNVLENVIAYIKQHDRKEKAKKKRMASERRKRLLKFRVFSNRAKEVEPVQLSFV